MEGLIEIKQAQLSDTIYSETRDNLQQARQTGDWKWYGDICVEAHAILVETGMLAPEQLVSVTRFKTLLGHCHLDAQVQAPEGKDE